MHHSIVCVMQLLFVRVFIKHLIISKVWHWLSCSGPSQICNKGCFRPQIKTHSPLTSFLKSFFLLAFQIMLNNLALKFIIKLHIYNLICNNYLGIIRFFFLNKTFECIPITFNMYISWLFFSSSCEKVTSTLHYRKRKRKTLTNQ